MGIDGREPNITYTTGENIIVTGGYIYAWQSPGINRYACATGYDHDIQ